MFVEESKKLLEIFGNEIIEIHHIGSTSIYGLKAKPIIDMMTVVSNITRIDLYNIEMVKMGYEAKGENGICGRRFFQKGGDQRTHHIHMFEWDNPEIIRHLAFRDFLRSHAKEAEKYGNVKEDLARRFPYDIESYINGKQTVISEIEQKALAWYYKLRS